MPPKKRRAVQDKTNEDVPLDEAGSSGGVKEEDFSDPSEKFLHEINQSRFNVASSAAEFKFDNTRVRILTEHKKDAEIDGPVLYWMARDGRVEDNWALLFAQKLGLKFEVPLHVCYCLVPKFLEASIRGFRFLLRGLQEVETDLRSRNIQFHLLYGEPPDVLPGFVRQHQIGGVVCDFAPLRVPMKWTDDVTKLLPSAVPLCQVDAHNVVPCWITSEKQEWAARTIRPKIHKKLHRYLTHFPPVILHPHSSLIKSEKVDWTEADSFLQCDRSVPEVDWLTPGSRAAMRTLFEFIQKRLPFYIKERGDPNQPALSNLSPYFHFGQISTQRVILEVQKLQKRHKESVDRYIEQALVRRELADNFCFYNPNYDTMEGAPEWARKSLKLHVKDKRDAIYSREQFENAETHDRLWNACQKQMLLKGKLHGFMRLYWAKKLLEWSETPEEALSTAIYLNDKYELDGRDPNGFVGCLWSIGGLHDRAFRERPVLGKVRWMSEKGCRGKFDTDSFIKTYA